MSTRSILFSAAFLMVGAMASLSQVPAPTPSPSPSQQPYRLSIGDVIEVRFFLNPELNESVQIRPDGRISMQVVGEIDVAGKTVPEATSEVEKAFGKELLSPKATIQVRSFAAQKIFVTGEVLKPGQLNLPTTMTLLEAISEAGGIKRTGDEKLAVLIRKMPDGKPLGRRIRWMEKGLPTPDANTPLQPFDVVMVPESKIARLDRWVDQYIRQMIPINASAGFTYLVQGGTGGGLIPII